MAKPVLHLHIGTMKTGTTYIQERLLANADSLASAGYLFPVSDGWRSQVRAARDLLQDGTDSAVIERTSGAWDSLLAEAKAWPGGHSIVSMEFLSFAMPKHVERIRETLEPFDVRVVLAVRDMTRTLPAQWQSYVRSGGVELWPAFVSRVANDAPNAKSEERWHFRRAQDVGRMIRVWSDALGPNRIRTLVFPRTSADPNALWNLFAEAVGFPAEATSQVPERSNPSLSHEAATWLTYVNRAAAHLSHVEYEQSIKFPYSWRVLTELSGDGTRPTVSEQGASFASEWNARTRARIAENDIRVFGTVEDLPSDVVPTAPREPSEDRLLEVAEQSVAGILAVLDETRNRLSQHRVDRARRTLGDEPVLPALEDPRRRWQQGSAPLEAAARDIVQTLRHVGHLRGEWLDARGRGERLAPPTHTASPTE